ncbi:MAG: hypothetical protein ACOC5T_09730 [Elusimicrobiota bacterium]
MVVSKKLIEIEGQRGALQIMLALQRNGEILYGNLYNNKPFVEISNNSTAKRAIAILLKHKLINERKTENRKAKYYRLSKRGTHIANLLVKIEKILDER